MNIQELLFKLGIPTYVYSVETVLTANIKVQIGDTMEVTMGWIYGMSVNIADSSADSSSISNISSAQASRLFLNLKYGQSIFVNKLRLDHLAFTEPLAATSKWQNPQKYFPCNIPSGTDLKQSTYSNPTLITGPQVALNFFYVDKTAYNNLVEQGLIGSNGIMKKRV